MKRISKYELINRLIMNAVNKLQITIKYGNGEPRVRIVVDDRFLLIVNYSTYKEIMNFSVIYTDLEFHSRFDNNINLCRYTFINKGSGYDEFNIYD